MHSRAVQSNSESRNGRHAATRCRRRMLQPSASTLPTPSLRRAVRSKNLRSTSRGLLQGPAEWSNNALHGLISQPNM
jgi:hypothetical protein